MMNGLLGRLDRSAPAGLLQLAQAPTGRKSVSGRPLYKGPAGGEYSEKTVTFPIDGVWYTFPSVDGSGNIMDEDSVAEYVRKNGPVDPVTGEKFPTFGTREDAEFYARNRSNTRLPR
jgi:hypothetical protein